jgi:hypothetical protein
MLHAAATELTKTVLDAVQRMVEEEVKRRLEPTQGTAEVGCGAPSVSPIPVQSARNEVTVVLWSSEIASYLNADSWQTRTQALGKVWKRTHECSFRDAREKWLLRGQKPMFVTSKHVMAEAEAVTATATASGSAPARKRRYAADPFVGVQTAADVERFRLEKSAKDVLNLYKTKGKLLEDDTARLFEKVIGQPVEHRNAGVIWESGYSGIRRPLTVRPAGPIVDPGPYVVMGELDGCLVTPPFENVPVEFKLRMGSQGVSATIPYRDILQVQSYMEIMGADRALHVQRSFGSPTVMTTTVEKDQEMWDTKIAPGMEAFVCDVRKLLRGSLADEEFRHVVLSAVETTIALPPIVKTRILEVETTTTTKKTMTTSSLKRKVPTKMPFMEIRATKYNLRKRGPGVDAPCSSRTV